MIGRRAIDDRVREWGLREDVVEKDYVLGWLLWAVGADSTLNAAWVFKGGTCLKKCYIETYRFSEDLDFTVMPDGPLAPDEMAPVLGAALQRAGDESGIDFAVRAPTLRMRPDGQSVEGRVYYRGPRNAPTPGSVKLDLTMSERVVRPTVLRAIAHAYDDALPPPGHVRCYSFEEVFAEKIRALAERTRPRDLYDVVNLFRRRDLRAEPQLIRAVLAQKCEAKGIDVPTYASLQRSPYLVELRSEWANMLAHQLPGLPPFEPFWEELEALFAWLEGSARPAELPALPVGAEEDASWTPPPTVWTWGAGVPIEVIRFAGANQLCIDLRYQRTNRLIEPYSLRRTRAGHLLLYAVKADTRELRSYRLDHIEGIAVTPRAFRPVYVIEFASAGTIAAPLVSPRPRTAGGPRAGRRGRSRRGADRTTYIVECTVCGKRFRRQRRNTVWSAHNDSAGSTCWGRHGYVVDQYID